jgi:hypothetical protein
MTENTAPIRVTDLNVRFSYGSNPGATLLIAGQRPLQLDAAQTDWLADQLIAYRAKQAEIATAARQDRSGASANAAERERGHQDALNGVKPRGSSANYLMGYSAGQH